MLIRKMKLRGINFGKAKVVFLLLSILLFHFISIAQDTVFNYNPNWTTYSLIQDPTVNYHLDTTITHFNRYNPAEAEFGYLHAGHLGAAASSMFFMPPKDAAFDIGFHQFDVYWRESNAAKFYDSKHPYTKVGYQQGTKVEVLGSFIHTQNILPQWSAGVNLNRYRTDGFYQRQVTKITNMDAFSRYGSQNGLYHLNVGYTLNSLKVEENGGVENLDVFVDTTLFDKSLQPVLLDSALNNWRNDALFFQNAIDFGKWENVKKNDSVTLKKVIPEFRLQHFFKWEKRGYRFNDAAIDNDYYETIYLDSVRTRDTLGYDSYGNELRFRVLKKNKGLLKNFLGDLYFHHDLYNIHAGVGDEQIQNGIGGIEINKLMQEDSSHVSGFDFHLTGQYNFIDRNAGDYQFRFQTDFRLGKSNVFSVELLQSDNHPSYIQQNYLSNHFKWDNNFSSFQTSLATIFWSEIKWRLKLSAQIFNIDNYIYWNQSALPAQFNGVLKGYAFFLQKDFSFKAFHFDNEWQYQSFSNDTIVSYPQFFSRHSLYFQNRLFKGALTSKIGLDIRYTSNYYAPAYMPETGQFYVQRYSIMEYYPVADLFITIQVKGVRAFAMFQHINKDLFGPGYFSVYRSPMPDRSFKLGLEWRFWN
ncbi:MAG: putative porin [Chitinophagales bacterium]